jgi:adenosylmethionine-8-amino-7-oxononanoate aminotransferase
MNGGIEHPQATRLAKRLADLLPGTLNHVFFSDSGSVAVEVAMKMAVQFHLNRGVEGRKKLVSFAHAYHGDTTGAMSLCDPINSMHAHFKGFLLEQFPSPLPRTRREADAFDAFVRRHRDNLAAVIIEPLIQGAGGMKFHPPETLRILRATCDRYGLLLIADEIATGFGRTGTMFACEQADVVPDIICLGKALTGGTMGMAATVATTEVFDAFYSDDPLQALMHGPTFMGNPLACAAANASLDLFEQEPRLAQAVAMEGWLQEGFASCRTIPGVVDVRCRGAVGVIQVAQLDRREALIEACVERGVWVRPFKDMIYVTPALTMDSATVQQLCSAISDATRRWAAEG